MPTILLITRPAPKLLAGIVALAATIAAARWGFAVPATPPKPAEKIFLAYTVNNVGYLKTCG